MGKEKKCTLYKKYTSYKKCIPYLILAGFTFFFCWWFVGRHGIFGAKVDWLSQHSVLPDYFRQQFLCNGKDISGICAESGRRSEHLSFCLLRTIQSIDSAVISAPICENVRLHHGDQHNRSDGFGTAFLLLAEKQKDGYRRCFYHIADVPAGGPDDRTVQRSDHVRRLYAVLMSGTYRCGPVF